MIFLGLSLFIAFFSWKRTVPMHQLRARILISDSQEGNAPKIGVGQDMLPGISLGSQSHLANQAILLKSRMQIEKTLRHLDFDISYFEVSVFSVTVAFSLYGNLNPTGTGMNPLVMEPSL